MTPGNLKRLELVVRNAASEALAIITFSESEPAGNFGALLASIAVQVAFPAHFVSF